MNITSKARALVCVVLLVLNPVLAILVLSYVSTVDNYGVIASLFAANAGTALFVRLVFGLPEFSEHTPGALRLFVLIIGVVYGLMSAVYWMLDEVDDSWLRAVIILPVLVILLVLTWFVDKVNKERTENERE